MKVSERAKHAFYNFTEAFSGDQRRHGCFECKVSDLTFPNLLMLKQVVHMVTIVKGSRRVWQTRFFEAN
jgi:hypothetical protein